jgi:Rrf2 family protein
MKLSTKGKYGLLAMLDLAVHSGGETIPLLNIAKRQDISLNYLEQVFGRLRQAGLLTSTKGPNGGYKLSKAASKIKVKEILEVLEGKFSIAGEESTKKTDSTENAVITEEVWQKIDEQVNEILDGVTLQTLVDECEVRESDGNIMFYI